MRKQQMDSGRSMTGRLIDNQPQPAQLPRQTELSRLMQDSLRSPLMQSDLTQVELRILQAFRDARRR